MCREAEGIFLWALEGLQRLIRNDYKFAVSEVVKENMKAAVTDGNNIIEFLDSEGDISDSFLTVQSAQRIYIQHINCSARATLSRCWRKRTFAHI